MSVIKFYGDVLTTLGVIVTEDGFVYNKTIDSKFPILDGDKSLVLPTKEHIDTVIVPDDDGKLVVTKLLYNPLNENAIKGETGSVRKTKVLIEAKLGYLAMTAGRLMLGLVMEPKFQKKTTTQLNKFMLSINAAQNNGIKELVDKTSIANWDKVYNKAAREKKGLLKFFLKKGGSIDGKKYNSTLNITSPLYDELVRAEDDKEVFGVKLRKKDLTIFKIIVEFLLTDIIKNDNSMRLGSLNGVSPAFITLMTAHLKILPKLNKVVKELKHINISLAESVIITPMVTLADLDELAQYAGEVLLLPDETDSNKKLQAQTQAPELAIDALNAPAAMITELPTMQPAHQPPIMTQAVPVVAPPTQQVQPVQQQPVYQQQVMQPQQYNAPVQQVAQQQPMQQSAPVDTIDKIDQALFGSSTQSMIRMPSAGMMVRPMGVNDMMAMQQQQQYIAPAQQVYAAPIQQQYAAPVQQQPMYPIQGNPVVMNAPVRETNMYGY